VLGTVDPETVLAYALASKKQEESDKALRKLVAIQGAQAQQLGDLRGLLQQL
jgi:hypothetical protein